MSAATTQYPVLPKEPAEALAVSLGYPANDLEMCNNCDATGYDWAWHDRVNGWRAWCGKCDHLGWVPRAWSYAFHGHHQPYAEHLAFMESRGK